MKIQFFWNQIFGWHQMKRSLKKVRFGGDEFVKKPTSKNRDFMASWATLQLECPFTRCIHFSLIYLELALPCRKNHCRGCSIVDSIKCSIFCGSRWSSPLSTESLEETTFLVPLFFLPCLHFAHEDARSEKSKGSFIFFSSIDPSHPLKMMEIKRNEQQKWQQPILTGDGSLGKDYQNNCM